MSKLRGVQIAGTGHYLPEKILTNQDLEKIVDTTDEWIRTMTGMKHRHVAAPEQATSDLCVEAAKKALEDANMTPADIDLIIVGTLTPDMMFPATGPLVQNKLGCRKIPAFDYSIACSGFIYGLSIAKQFVASGTYNNVLVITGEILTRITDYTDRNTAVLFGDAASAAIVTPSEKNKFLGFSLGTDGSETELLYQPAGGSKIPASHESIDQRLHYLKMEGPSIFRLAVNSMISGLKGACKEAGVKTSDLDWIIPHQANIRIMETVTKFAKLNPEQLINTIEIHGNTSASTVGLALDISIREGKIKRGDIIGLTAFGAGLSWGGAVLEY